MPNYYQQLTNMLFLYLLSCSNKSEIECDTLLCAVSPTIESVPFRLRKIPAGQDPQRRYSISQDLYTLIHEVTQRQYRTVMSRESYEGLDPLSSIGPNFPATYVSWHMAAEFSNALTEQFNDLYNSDWTKCYDCNDGQCIAMSPASCSGFRLPTEAEWEYIARSGSTKDFWTGSGPYQGGTTEEDVCSSDLVIYDDGDMPQLQDFAWYCYTSNSQPIGQKLPNGFGMYDIHGNVWEWTHDNAGCDYPDGEMNPYCSIESNDAIARGGAWSSFPYYLATSNRSLANKHRRDNGIGFRLIRSSISE